MLVWMAVWWMNEAVEIEVTSLLPIVAFPLFCVRSIAATAAPYASDVVFLFLGGFVLALAIHRWGLDRRIAFLTLRLVGTTPARLVAIRMRGVPPFSGLGDSMIAIGAAIALFLMSVDRKRGVRAMDWEHAIKLPWGVLILFGGGLTLVTLWPASSSCR
jgi:di/tricarboxylate transporter